MIIIGGIFKSKEDFEIYKQWLKDNNYTYEDSFKEEILNKFLSTYYGNERTDPLKDKTIEEIVEIAVSSIQQSIKEDTFNPNNVNIPIKLYLAYGVLDNIKYYEYYKKSKIKHIFLVKEEQKELYNYILSDISKNKLMHEVEYVESFSVKVS
jgi:hypothetical protein